MVPLSILRAFEKSGGVLRTDSKVSTITCEGPAVRGVTLSDGTEITAPVVVSACNPHDTFLHWLRNPPPQASNLVNRWKEIPHADGYESKIDAVLSAAPRVRATAEAGFDRELATTIAVAPSIADMHRGYQLMASGAVLERPGFLANTPSVDDTTLAPAGRHVFSLETLFTPYAHPGGWASSPEPRRWLELFGELTEPGFLDTIIDWRAVTPDRYETDFHLPHGHATSFAGGPLAAMRNKNPELTRYETAVRGLYLTGAATFPGAAACISPVRPRSPGRVCGVPVGGTQPPWCCVRTSGSPRQLHGDPTVEFVDSHRAQRNKRIEHVLMVVRKNAADHQPPRARQHTLQFVRQRDEYRRKDVGEHDVEGSGHILEGHVAHLNSDPVQLRICHGHRHGTPASTSARRASTRRINAGTSTPTARSSRTPRGWWRPGGVG